MTGYEVCKIFLGIRKHFTGKYDYVSAGPIPMSPESYGKQKTVLINRYEYIGSKFKEPEKLEEYMLATIVDSTSKIWIGSVITPEAAQTHSQWQGRMQSLNYNFKSELKRLMLLHNGFNTLFAVKPNEHPEIFKALMRRELSLESFVMLDIATNFIAGLDRKLNDVIWKTHALKAKCYRPFIETRGIDKRALRTTLAQVAKDLGLTN